MGGICIAFLECRNNTMRMLHNSIFALILLSLFFPTDWALSHEGHHEEEDTGGSYSTDDESDNRGKLPVRASKGNKLPSPPSEYSARRRRSAEVKNPFSIGFFVSLDVPMIGNSEEPIASTAQNQSGTVHHAGDQHKALDGHDHHHGVLAFVCPTGSRCHGGEDHSAPTPDSSAGQGGSSSVLTPIATVKAGYAFSKVLSLGVNVSTDFSSGVKDPTFGPSLLFPIADRYQGIFSILASAPLSGYSRDNGKITTLTGSLNTLYSSDDGFFAGGGFQVSGSFYGNASNNTSSSMNNTNTKSAIRYHNEPPTPSTNHTETTQAAQLQVLNPQELVRTGGSLFTGLMLTDRISANISLGLGTTYKDDQSFGWLTDITVARLGYSASGFTGGVAFSFLSDSKGTEAITFPSEPFIGLKIQYVFGALSTLGIVGTDSLGH